MTISLKADAFRFLLAGGFNTFLTIIVYQLLLFFTGHQLAYALSWVIGLTYVYLIYPNKVFVQSNPTRKEKIQSLLGYVCIYVLGAFCLELLLRSGIDRRLAIIFVIAITTAFNFTLMRLLFRK